MPAKTTVRVEAASVPGRRPDNEDYYGDLRDLPPALGQLYVVADGMGGHASGEVASHLAVDTIKEVYARGAGGSPSQNLEQAIQAANERIYQAGSSGENSGMGTTVVTAAIVGGFLYVAHVGDSRAYYLRDQKLTPLTRDHTFVNDQIANHVITEEEALRSPQRHVLSRAVGKQPQVQVELAQPLALKAGDVILMCSDGLCGYVQDEELQFNLVVRRRDPTSAVETLLYTAEQSGSDDNITVAVILVESVANKSAAVFAKPALPAAAAARKVDQTEPVPIHGAGEPPEPPALDVVASPRRGAPRWLFPVFGILAALVGVAVGLGIAWVLMPALLQTRAGTFSDVNAQLQLWEASDVILGTPAPTAAPPLVETVMVLVVATPTPAPTATPVPPPTAAPTPTPVPTLPPPPVVIQTVVVTVEVPVTVVLTPTSLPTSTPTETPAPGPTPTVMASGARTAGSLFGQWAGTPTPGDVP